MAGATQHRQPAAAAPAPVYQPTPADLAEMCRIKAVHDLLDVASDLPLSVRLDLLDYAAGVLEGGRRAVSAADRADA